MKTYVGNCANLFRQNGECVLPELFSDVSDFVVQLENARKMSRLSFLRHVEMPLELRRITHPKRSDFLSIKNGKIYILQDTYENIEYVFA